ncbi:MAG: YncE family protein [Candidatus Pedobacter colombiensis]|uniref:YncE family protein n=1 Tax=Candidatus Pedobacter colombiensis TaxID=3121371 RepID=A0AAJ5W6U7_9SPHI|nr:YncE family protein [Pedobacter sp.]WEK18635.1 MAG: YncE family protein [Pedobacter sp.]
MKKKAAITAVLLSLSAAMATQAQTTTGTHLLHTYRIGSDGGWDYLLADPASNNLYVAHGTQVNILNKKTGDSVGVILNTPRVHGIALVPVLNKGYTSNGKSGECTVFNTLTHVITGRVKVGENPDAIIYDDFSKKVIVFNGRSLDASVIDPKTDKVIATVALGGKPEAGVSDGKGNIYVNIETKNQVVRFDATTFKVTGTFNLEGGEEPTGLAIDRTTSRLFVGCSNKTMLILDAGTGKKIAALPIGEESDGIAFDPALKLAYSSNGDGTLTIVKESNANKFTVLENIKTVSGARTITLDPVSHHIFMPVADFKPATEKGKRPTKIPGTFRVLEYGI